MVIRAYVCFRHLNRLVKKAFSEGKSVATLLQTYNIKPNTVLKALKYHQLYNSQDCAMGEINILR